MKLQYYDDEGDIHPTFFKAILSDIRLRREKKENFAILMAREMAKDIMEDMVKHDTESPITMETGCPDCNVPVTIEKEIDDKVDFKDLLGKLEIQPIDHSYDNDKFISEVLSDLQDNDNYIAAINYINQQVSSDNVMVETIDMAVKLSSNVIDTAMKIDTSKVSAGGKELIEKMVKDAFTLLKDK